MQLPHLLLPIACVATVAVSSYAVHAAPRTAEATVNGQVFVVGVPAGFQAAVVAGGLRLWPSDADERRNPYEITIRLEAAGTVPASLDRRRAAGDRIARYRIDRIDGGGSGGDETTLEAAVPCELGTIRLRLDTQAENGVEPDLRPVWTVLEAARCRPAR